MDPQHPQRGADASAPVNDLSTAHTTGNPRSTVAQGLGPHVPPTNHTVLPGIAKDAIIDGPQVPPAPDDGVVRESWVSFASTAASRDSAVPSIFSVRASTASAATRYSVRQSLMESPISATSPMHQEHRKSSFPQGPRYCCTFCDAAFDTKEEWKLHEFDFHDRPEQYPCGSCQATFPRAALLDEHLRDDHGLDPGQSAVNAVQHSPIRRAWGCGFCAAFIPSRNDYLEHIGRHYDEGKGGSEWQHTRVIEGLLQQPKVEASWMALVSREERAKGTKLRFVWPPATTGRTADPREPHSLQDMLEFFAGGTTTPDEVAAAAYRDAQIRHEGNVSELISRLYLRKPEPNRGNPIHHSAQPSPELHPAYPEGAEDVVSPMSPLPAPLRPLTAPPRPRPFDPPIPNTALTATSEKLTASFEQHSSKPSTSQAVPFARPRVPAASMVQHSFQPNLRRVDSDRALELSKRAGALLNLDHHGDIMLPETRSSKSSSGIPPIELNQTEPRPRSPSRHGEALAGNKGKSLAVTRHSPALSVRPHTSSSTLSTHTCDGSHGLCDSTSERMSDDSVSEPESWLEVDGIPAATIVWKRAFQQRVDRGMGQLWDRFNRDWNALIRQCVGDRSSNSSQYRDSGRIRKGGSSRNTPGRGLHPNARLPDQEDEEDDDEGESYRPPSSMSKRSSDSVKRFACPFRKHDPHTYNMQDYEVCTVRSWSTISRLKEHLYRRHYKVHCQRCKQTFSDAKELAAHEMSIVGCEFSDRPPPCDITAYQEKQLKSRKHTSRRQTDEEKWRDIYRLLFPNEEIPSPYPETAEDMMPVSSEGHASLNFQHFLLNEMPTLFNQTAEEHAGRCLQARDALPMEAIPRIIEDALQKAFRTWEARGSELPTREASVARTSFLPETPTSIAYSYGQVTAYQTPQPLSAMDGFPQDHFGNADFTPEVSHAAHANDSGFGEGSFFTSAPPMSFNAFAAPQYERSPWDANLSMMDTGAFDADLSMGGHFRGFQNS